jgi:predicted Ser/Thr protein kinase
LESSLIGKVDIRKLGFYGQNYPDAYSYSYSRRIRRRGQCLWELINAHLVEG